MCYAYVVGADSKEERYSDDGEPSGTAGRPIAGQLKSAEITNVVAIVVRYFGGILLGTGGLIVAYKEATKDALTNAQIVERDIMQRAKVTFPIEKTNEVMRLIRATGSTILSQDFTDKQIYEINIKRSRLSQWSHLDYTIEINYEE